VFCFKDDIIQVTVSIGVAVAEAGVVADYDQMKHIAAAALAEAKLTGRNRSVLHCLRPIEQAG
jgi:PleD family two-component response regulator